MGLAPPAARDYAFLHPQTPVRDLGPNACALGAFLSHLENLLGENLSEDYLTIMALKETAHRLLDSPDFGTLPLPPYFLTGSLGFTLLEMADFISSQGVMRKDDFYLPEARSLGIARAQMNRWINDYVELRRSGGSRSLLHPLFTDLIEKTVQVRLDSGKLGLRNSHDLLDTVEDEKGKIHIEQLVYSGVGANPIQKIVAALGVKYSAFDSQKETNFSHLTLKFENLGQLEKDILKNLSQSNMIVALDRRWVKVDQNNGRASLVRTGHLEKVSLHGLTIEGVKLDPQGRIQWFYLKDSEGSEIFDHGYVHMPIDVFRKSVVWVARVLHPLSHITLEVQR